MTDSLLIEIRDMLAALCRHLGVTDKPKTCGCEAKHQLEDIFQRKGDHHPDD